MKKLVLLGDSIRQIGYGSEVARRLEGEFETWQPEDNCRFAAYTLRGLYDWREGLEGADIIHWNNGLWDTCELYGDGPFTPTDIYIREMCRLAELLKLRAERVIFATTTPVREPCPYNRNEAIERTNALLVPELRARGILINDLYTLLSEDIEVNIREDDRIHLSATGIDRAAAAVISTVREAARSLKEE